MEWIAEKLETQLQLRKDLNVDCCFQVYKYLEGSPTTVSGIKNSYQNSLIKIAHMLTITKLVRKLTRFTIPLSWIKSTTIIMKKYTKMFKGCLRWQEITY